MVGESASVIIPTYNRAKLIGRAVRSALAAIDEGDEIIVVDDGSADDTPRRIAAFGSKVRYIRTENGGVARARNVGIAAARCPMITLLDSDDEWQQDKLLLQKQAMAHWPDAVFCCGEFSERRSDGSERPNHLRRWTHERRPWSQLFGAPVQFSSLGELPPGRKDLEVYYSSMYRAMLHECYACTDTFLVRKALAGDALKFPEDQRTIEDWECFSRVSKKGPGVFMDCCLAWEWEHDGPRVSDAAQHEFAICRVRMTERIWGADPDFMAQYPGVIEAELASTHLMLARRALATGQHTDAKAELTRSGASMQANLYRVLASLPSPVHQGMRAVRRLMH
jgi:glycosyltransferase involved in cell wall biosynthesis